MELYILGAFGVSLMVVSAIHGYARTHKGKMTAIWLAGVVMIAEAVAYAIVAS